jgi:heterodisulfide reductase subunit A-like polyferredoxin
MAGVTIVVGGGLSGLSSAHTLLENGESVILIERNLFMVHIRIVSCSVKTETCVFSSLYLHTS